MITLTGAEKKNANSMYLSTKEQKQSGNDITISKLD